MAAPLGQVTVLSFTRMTALLRAPQYATTSTSPWLHSSLQAAVWQLERITRTALSVAAAAPGGPGGPSAPWGPGSPGGPGGPAGPGSPFSPAGPTAPGSPFGPSPQLARQTESTIAAAILFTEPVTYRIHGLSQDPDCVSILVPQGRTIDHQPRRLVSQRAR